MVFWTIQQEMSLVVKRSRHEHVEKITASMANSTRTNRSIKEYGRARDERKNDCPVRGYSSYSIILSYFSLLQGDPNIVYVPRSY